MIDDHSKIWERIIGTRGYTGTRAISARPTFDSYYDLDGPDDVGDELKPELLEQLEESLDV